MPEHPTNPARDPTSDRPGRPERCEPSLVRGVRRWVLLRQRWFRKLERWQRWTVRVGVGVPLLLIAAFFVLTRSPLTGAILLPRLSAALNLGIEADSVYVRLNGVLVLEGVRARIPGVDGPAGLVAQIERLSADVDWPSTLRGSARVREVDLLQPVIRVSQSIKDESLNIERFRLLEGPRRVIPSRPGLAAPPLDLPRVLATDGAIELCEHDDGVFAVLKRLPVDGMLTPAPGGERGYVVALTEHRTERPGRRGTTGLGFQLRGRFDSTSIALEMDNFSLADWPPSTVPTPFRELFAKLALQGDVTRAAFGYDDREGVTAELAIEGGELSLPIEPEGAPPPGAERMRMRGVTGSATFKQNSVLVRARGVLEDLPYTVTLLYDGTSVDSPFTCEIVCEKFRVDEHPRLLPYAPALVRKRLETFSGPTATLSTTLQISRGHATASGPGEIRFKGWMDLSNGRAAFDKFPYPFENISGRVSFDNNGVEIRDVTGVSPSGARLKAHGVVAPAHEDAEIDIFVTVEGAPVDEAIEEAFGPGRDRLMHALFNKPKHQALVDAGLILTPDEAVRLRAELDAALASRATEPDDPAALERRIADLQRRLETPVFDFGGLADISVHVHRPLGDQVEWETNIDIRLAHAGLVPDAFPLPVHLRDVTCQIRNEQATISGGEYRGLMGGTAEVTGTFSLPPTKRPDADPRPDVTIEARAFPLDALMIHALPGPDDGALKKSLRALGLSGSGVGRVRIAPLDLLGRAQRAERTPTGFDAALTVSGVTVAPPEPGSAPDAVPPEALVADGTGSIAVTERTLDLKLDALTAGAVGAGVPVKVHTVATFGFRPEPGAPATAPEITATVVGAGLDFRAPVERIIRAFSARAADEVVRLRARYSPEGFADAETRIVVADNATRSVGLDVTNLRGAAFDWLGGRVGLAESLGRVEVECARGVSARFDGLAGAMTFDGAPLSGVKLDGWYRFTPTPDGAAPFEGADRVLHVAAENGRFESPFVTAVLAAPVGRDRLAAYEKLKPRGTFSADVDIRDGWQTPIDAATPGKLKVAGTLEPRSFACEIDGVPVAFERCAGWITFGGAEGVFNRLAGHAANWSFTVDGDWRQAAGGGLVLDLALASTGSALTPDARVVIPEKLRKSLDDIKLKIEGPFNLQDARLTLLAGVEPSKAWTRFRGNMGFERVSIEAGASISECAGRLSATYEQPAGGVPDYRVSVFADQMSIAGAIASDARAVIQSGAHPGEVVIPLFSGDCHGGRFAGHVRVAPAGQGDREFEATFQAGGVDFGLLLHDLSAKMRSVALAADPAADLPPAKPRPEPGQRGSLDAEMSVAGFVSVPETRRGRGMIRVTGEGVRVIDLPGVLPLIEVSNLQLPAGDALDHAEACYFVDGGVVSFDSILIDSGTIEIAGYGTMQWPSMEMDLRFNSRSARPIPMVSWLFQGIRDQLVATGVRGKPNKPDVKLISMPGPRRMLGSAVGAEETDRARQLRALERRAGLSRAPIRPTPGPGTRPSSSADATTDGP
ncbi:MAG: hypothetical protein ACKVU4_15660 [Phycisphaerales bacterium]